MRITSEGTVKLTYVPNIRTISRHSECWKQENPWLRVHRTGDVRYCPHGRIQVLTQVPITARTQGPGTDYWRTLSPIWDPIKYRRARKALGRG
ncbi:hypothetical protein [Pseudarthrobacter sp. LMD1-1-1.1]|uniref:hypothetical protein n=1 Tax=Pseudarthrobacter sp. LMD1-1-1.1 TaxID=3135242 RepID=UPI0034290F75